MYIIDITTGVVVVLVSFHLMVAEKSSAFVRTCLYDSHAMPFPNVVLIVTRRLNVIVFQGVENCKYPMLENLTGMFVELGVTIPLVCGLSRYA